MWRPKFQSYRRAFRKLSIASELSLDRPLTGLEQLGLIHMFEFTHELAWKSIEDFLRANGTTQRIFGSKDATREAVAAGLIENGELWTEMIQCRSLTRHAYDEETRERMAHVIISGYIREFELLEQRMLSRAGSAESKG